MRKQWQVKEIDNKILPELPEYPSLILKLLALREMTDPEKIRDFLDPDYAKLHDPFKFRDMQKAVERIEQAIKRKEKITIYADYDADAITACATLYLALKKLDGFVDYYIPDRFSEGYGMNPEAIKKIVDSGTNLIIAVDCGINAVEEAALCNFLGTNLIITDHHELTGVLPEAFAIINPKNPQDEYPFPYLTGVGVAYKLVQALIYKFKNQNSKIKIVEGWEKWLLDLVAIGTVADCQSLTGENRILVSFGIKVLEKTRWPGLRALIEAAGIGRKIDAYTLGFVIAPRINAAGRIKHADAAFKLLISDNVSESQKLAQELDQLNKHRQALTDQILSEARSQIEIGTDKKILFVTGTDWPKGIVGLVAGKLAEEYNRPVLAISATAEGMAVGSARSVAGFNMVAALNFAKDWLQKYGGHSMAAGFTLSRESLQNFQLKLLEYAEFSNLTISNPVLEIDASVSPEDISWEVLEYLEKLGPFGIDNLKPKLVGIGLEVLDYRLVGAKNQHLKMQVRFGQHILEAIAFGQGFFANNIGPGTKIDAVFELSANEWNGNKEMQLKIIDVKIHE